MLITMTARTVKNYAGIISQKKICNPIKSLFIKKRVENPFITSNLNSSSFRNQRPSFSISNLWIVRTNAPLRSPCCLILTQTMFTKQLRNKCEQKKHNSTQHKGTQLKRKRKNIDFSIELSWLKSLFSKCSFR